MINVIAMPPKLLLLLLPPPPHALTVSICRVHTLPVSPMMRFLTSVGCSSCACVGGDGGGSSRIVEYTTYCHESHVTRHTSPTATGSPSIDTISSPV